MSTSDVREYMLALPPRDRLALARELLDSLQNDESEWELDDGFAAEIQRRRKEMLRGEQVVPDWRAAMQDVRRTLESGDPL